MADQSDQLNINEIRGMLSGVARSLGNGDTSAANANAMANVVGKIISSYKLEMEYMKMVGKQPNIPMMLSQPDAPEGAKPDGEAD